MLVLMRRPGERILIGKDVAVMFVGMAGGQAKIGVEAPRHVRVLREELERYDIHDEREDR